jgi:hypothetical protein
MTFDSKGANWVLVDQCMTGQREPRCSVGFVQDKTMELLSIFAAWK